MAARTVAESAGREQCSNSCPRSVRVMAYWGMAIAVLLCVHIAVFGHPPSAKPSWLPSLTNYHSTRPHPEVPVLLPRTAVRHVQVLVSAGTELFCAQRIGPVTGGCERM